MLQVHFPTLRVTSSITIDDSSAPPQPIIIRGSAVERSRYPSGSPSGCEKVCRATTGLFIAPDKGLPELRRRTANFKPGRMNYVKNT